MGGLPELGGHLELGGQEATVETFLFAAALGPAVGAAVGGANPAT